MHNPFTKAVAIALEGTVERLERATSASLLHAKMAQDEAHEALEQAEAARHEARLLRDMITDAIAKG